MTKALEDARASAIVAAEAAAVETRQHTAQRESPRRASRKERRRKTVVRYDSDFEDDGTLIPKTKNKQDRATGPRGAELNLYHVSPFACLAFPSRTHDSFISAM